MNSRSGVLSLLTNRGIAMKVGLGFACVLALLAFVSGEAYLVIPDRRRRASRAMSSASRRLGSPATLIGAS